MLKKVRHTLKFFENFNAAELINGKIQDSLGWDNEKEISFFNELCDIIESFHSQEETFFNLFKKVEAELPISECWLAFKKGQTDLVYYTSHKLIDHCLAEEAPPPIVHLVTKVIATKSIQVMKVPADSELEKRDSSNSKSKNYLIGYPLEFSQDMIGCFCFNRLPPGSANIHLTTNLIKLLCHLFSQSRIIYREKFYELSMTSHSYNQHPIQEDQSPPSNMIGKSKSVRDVYQQIHQVAASDTTVLILGESGVGKELVANAIRCESTRAKKPFIKINCAALPETLLESELFGHEKGSFTGALSLKKGKFELAESGTILLDEIGDISPAIQIKLLRVLQEREFQRIGGERTLGCNVRIIAATNKNLEEMVSAGTFRLDLYYRLNVFPILVPSLRDRKVDIIPLADHFLAKYEKIAQKEIHRITKTAIDLMIRYHWPGNIRELENCMERAVLLTTDGDIHSHHLPPSMQLAHKHTNKNMGSLRDTLYLVEKAMISDELKRSNGNMAEAARQLGLTERMMGLRVKKFGLEPKGFKIKQD
ncbi:MAG: sigma-54 interaction domain-containing protein [Oligoflexales bacterium]